MKIRPAALILGEGGLLVLRYRYGGRERLNLPGGNLEPGETVLATLTRELKEELGIRAGEGARLVMLAETVVQGGVALHPLFHLPDWRGEPVLRPGETRAEALVWLPPEAWAGAALYPAVGEWLVRWREHGTCLGHVGPLEQPWFS